VGAGAEVNHVDRLFPGDGCVSVVCDELTAGASGAAAIERFVTHIVLGADVRRTAQCHFSDA